MELEELKNTWETIDERLKKQEVLKENLIREIIYSKSNKSLSKLINFEVLSLVIYLLIIPVIAFAYNKGLELLLAGKIFAYFMASFCIFGAIWQLIKMKNLRQIDFTKNISANSLFINKYNILIKKEKSVTMIFITPVISFLCIYLYAIYHATFTLWIFLISALLIAIFLSYNNYKRIYDKNIASIQKSLEALKELEEE
jgi:hypothetical protein